ncbi:MAG: hypothetical protein ACE37B_00070 [Ilumatobacter sp.]|jgi:hypothetical protein|uniref:hypothetical protein n=1 Tax=Ilumatobacter sp. TaxID=1967498 RepID=UPI00391B3F32
MTTVDDMQHDTDWYWDLRRERAVPASERGPGDQTLGPYPSRAEAENWRSTVETRNDAWQDADDDWNDEQPDEQSG